MSNEPAPASPDQEMAELTDELDTFKFTLTDKERIRRLAESDPEKAKELITYWLKKEKNN